MDFRLCTVGEQYIRNVFATELCLVCLTPLLDDAPHILTCASRASLSEVQEEDVSRGLNCPATGQLRADLGQRSSYCSKGDNNVVFRDFTQAGKLPRSVQSEPYEPGAYPTMSACPLDKRLDHSLGLRFTPGEDCVWRHLW